MDKGEELRGRHLLLPEESEGIEAELHEGCEELGLAFGESRGFGPTWRHVRNILGIQSRVKTFVWEMIGLPGFRVWGL